ncbi:hypothetical protein [Listeria fleischmannii]|nr:hypothetical protein [Listeria fleischmannii]EMG29302.1 wall-associated protein [Listeria fleischmannii subsp. fleischmannii LU2006-1]
MKKIWKKGLLSLMSASLVLSLIPPYTGFAEEEGASQKDTDKVEEKRTEVKDERTETEIVYDNHDGSFTKQIFSEPIHVEVDGEMERVNPELEKDSVTEKIAPKQTQLDI